MTLERLTGLTRPPLAGEAAHPVVRIDAPEEIAALVAWFGDEPGRDAARLIVAGADHGVLDRAALYPLVTGRTLGWGDSIGGSLPGTPRREPRELTCPEPGCPDSPVWVLRFDPAAPPRCARHPGEALQPAP